MTTKDKLIIFLDHPCPEEFIKDIQLDIIKCLQNQPPNPTENETGYFLLELLKQTMELEG